MYKILIIEDDKDLAQLTKLALEKENFTVDICLDGAEGLYYMQENMYDLVLLDRMLPSMDGTQVLKEARQSNISTPVIFLTALGELQDKVNGLNCGADDYSAWNLIGQGKRTGSGGRRLSGEALRL